MVNDAGGVAPRCPRLPATSVMVNVTAGVAPRVRVRCVVGHDDFHRVTLCERISSCLVLFSVAQILVIWAPERLWRRKRFHLNRVSLPLPRSSPHPEIPASSVPPPLQKGATGDFSVSAISSVFLCCLVFAQASSLWPQASSEGRSSCPLKNVYQQIV